MQTKILLIFLLFSGFIFAQNSTPEKENSARILELDQAIQNAINKEQYKKASKLQKEEDIRKKMAIAFKSKDYDRLAELKNDLDNCNCIIKEETTEKSTKSNAKASTEDLKDSPTNRYRNNRFVTYFEFMPLAYMHVKSTSSYIQEYPPHDMVFGTKTNDLEGGGFRIGGTIFFRDMRPDQKLKIGFDIMFVSFTSSLDFRDPGSGVIYFSLARPGIVLKQYLNNYSGLQFKLNIGSTFAVSTIHAVAAGAKINLSYWFKNFTAGIEYQLFESIDTADEDAYVNQLGITCGFQF